MGLMTWSLTDIVVAVVIDKFVRTHTYTHTDRHTDRQTDIHSSDFISFQFHAVLNF